MRVELRDRDDYLVQVPPGMTLGVQSYADDATGGPADAKVTVQGPAEVVATIDTWLGYGVRIFDEMGVLRWWGFVEGTYSNFLRKSLSQMYNRIRVIYSQETPNGTVTGVTDWAENADFVARYGYREAEISLNDGDETAALAAQADALASLEKKITEPELGNVDAYLECVGLWDTLDWRYYENLAGRDVFESMASEQVLGWEVTGSEDFGFCNNRIADKECRLYGIPVGTMIGTQYTGLNNRVHTVTEATEITEKVVGNYTDVRFDSDDDLHLHADNEDFLGFSEGEMVIISGTVDNNGGYFLVTLEDDYIGVKPKNIVGEDPTTPTMIQGNSVKVAEHVNVEVPLAGNPISITAYGVKVAQSFELEQSLSWTLAEVWLNLKRVGTVSDDVTIELRADNSGEPGTLMESTTIDGETIPTAGWWMAAEFANASTLSPSTTYWLEISRTGTADDDNFYILGMSEDLYPRGDMLLRSNVATWVSRVPDASIAFRLLGRESAADQMDAMADYCGFDFTSAVDGDLELYQYRDGSLTVRDELMKLLAQADSSGERWLPSMTPDGALRITAMPSAAESVGILNMDGELRTKLGRPWPDGQLVAGNWIEFDGRLGHDPIFVERSEWSAGGGLRLEPGAGRFRLGQAVNR